eukprot:646037_1
MSQPKSKLLTLSVICFSKDRPWQLEQLILSVLKYWRGPYTYSVLYTSSSNKFENAYQHLINEFSAYSNIHFVRESNFDENVFDLIQSTKSQYICFHVDDMIFYRSLDIVTVLDFLSDKSNRLMAFFPKLNEHVDYCHPSSSSAPTPTFTTKLKKNYKKFGIWMPLQHTSDWNYLWDLCGTIYAKQDVITIYQGIKNKFPSKCLSPNRFEVLGNKLINLIYPGMSMNMFAACYKKPIMSVITINRVQKDYNVPIYDKFQKSVDELLVYFINEREIDLHKYSLQTFNSVHISELKLMPKKDKRIKDREKQMIVASHEQEEKEVEIDISNSDVEEWKQWLLTQTEQQDKKGKQD